MPQLLLLAAMLAGEPARMLSPSAPAAGGSEARLAPSGSAATVAEDPFAAAVAAGDAAFALRDEPVQLEEALARYREASTLRPSAPGPLVALARAAVFKAESDQASAAAAWRDASRAAERALRAVAPGAAAAMDRSEPASRVAAAVDARGAVPLYWLALSVMGMAQSRGMSAVLAVKDDALAMMRRAAELDDRTDFGGPRRALGAWLATIPSAAGGGAAASRAQLERARALYPEYQLTSVRDAGVLSVLLQDRARFDAVLAGVLAFDPSRDPEIAPENRLAQRMARELLARREQLF